MVLDGLERLLPPYSGQDAPYAGPQQFGGHGEGITRSCTDLRDGEFLRKLLSVNATRVLISTRLVPTDIQDMHTGKPLPGAYVAELQGLNNSDAVELEGCLTELEERSLVGWDRNANRYDLHLIIRGVAWNVLAREAQVGIREQLCAYFSPIAGQLDAAQVERIADLTPALELYHNLVALKRYDEVAAICRDRLQLPLVYRFNEGRLRVDLMDSLFSENLEALPRLTRVSDQSWAVNARAQAYSLYGRPGSAVKIDEWFLTPQSDNTITPGQEDYTYTVQGIQILSGAGRLSGALSRSYAAACSAPKLSRQASDLFQEATSLDFLGFALAVTGKVEDAARAGRRMDRILGAVGRHSQAEAIVKSRLAEFHLMSDEPAVADDLATRAWEAAVAAHTDRDNVDIARLKVHIDMAIGGASRFTAADEHLHYALVPARDSNLLEQELPTMVCLTEQRWRQHNPDAARDLLEQVNQRSKAGPYPLTEADAYILFSIIERDANNRAAIVSAASQAFVSAWCDGPPFAYSRGLNAARKMLTELGAPEPGHLQPFVEDGSQEEIEIHPKDRFFS